MTARINPTDKNLKNCKKQAKRLAKALSVSLSVAQELLAKAIYRCDGWEDLKSSLREKHPSNNRLLLASITPDSEEDNIASLEENIDDIALDINQLVLHSRNKVQLLTMIWQVFGFKEKCATLSDVFKTLPELGWRPSFIGGDLNAVIYTDMTMNGVTFRLIGTRCHRPEYYQWASDEALSIVCGDIEYEGIPRIIWSEPEQWESAQRKYVNAVLTASDSDDNELAESPDFPEIQLSESMLAHQQWFDTVNDYFGGYEWGMESRQVPIMFGSGLYLIYGFPLDCEQVSKDSVCTSITFKGDLSNDSMPFLFSGQPIGVEFIQSDASGIQYKGREDSAYFDKLQDILFSHPLCEVSACSGPYDSSLLVFFRPVTTSEIEYNLKTNRRTYPGIASWVLKSDNIENAKELVNKLYKRDLFKSPDESDNNNLYTKMEFWEENNSGFSISFEYKSGNRSGFINIITTSSTRQGEKGVDCYLTIQEIMLKLARRVSKKDLLGALQYGLVMYTDEQFIEYLMDDSPSMASKLPSYPEGESSHYSIDHSAFEGLSIWDLCFNTRLTEYEKD